MVALFAGSLIGRWTRYDQTLKQTYENLDASLLGMYTTFHAL